jgi:adenylate cyclase
MNVSLPASAEDGAIAVNGFTAITNDAEERWLAEGLVEDVVAALSRFRWLTVRAPNTSLTPTNQATRGHDAGSRYIVQGALRRSGERVRISVHLVDMVTGSRLWTDRFDGKLTEGLELQDRVAAVVAGSIEPTVLMAEAHRFGASSDRDTTPYVLYARAQPIFSSGKNNVLQSLTLLERAIELDPNYGPALADAANCRQILDVNGWADDRQLNRSKAIDLARKALQVSGGAEPVAIAAFVLTYFGEDIDTAVGLLDNALALNPNFAKGWYMRGMAGLYAGQSEQAIECFETSLRLNPRDRVGRRNIAGIGIAHLFNQNFDAAVPMLRPVIHEFPRWATPYCALASCHAHLGFLEESEAVATRLRAADASPVPSAIQFRDNRHRELLKPGLKLAANLKASF